MIEASTFFEPGTDGHVRVARFMAWLGQVSPRPLSGKKADMVRWLVESRAAKLPMWLVISGDDWDEALNLDIVNPFFDRDRERYVCDFQEFGFIVRYSDLDLVVASRIRDWIARYQACLGIIEWKVAFETEKEFEGCCLLFGVRPASEEGDPLFDINELASVLSEKIGISRDAVFEYDQYQAIYLSSLGIM